MQFFSLCFNIYRELLGLTLTMFPAKKARIPLVFEEMHAKFQVASFCLLALRKKFASDALQTCNEFVERHS